MRIDLGCGNSKHEGCDTFIDRVDFGHNVVCNFEIEKLPFKDNSVDYIWSNHVLEHIKDPQLLMNECWRVLKKDSKFEIHVPYGLWPGASKPVHLQYITACWFDWFRRKDLFKWYGYHNWIIQPGDLKEVKNNNGEIYEVYCIMSPDK